MHLSKTCFGSYGSCLAKAKLYWEQAKQHINEIIHDIITKERKLRGLKEEPAKPAVPRRPMKFPYTYSAKIAHFPWRYYIKNNWIYRYYFISLIFSIPAFNVCNNLANSPGNVQKWAAIREQEQHEEHH